MKVAFGLALAFFVTALGCGTETGVEVSSQTNGDVAALQKSDYFATPRCGPRPCIAMCVTCLYDRCRISGGTVEECKEDMESCKESCVGH